MRPIVSKIETSRLVLIPWHEGTSSLGVPLAEIVRGLVTPEVSRTLPPPWRGPFNEDGAAERWIEDRDGESTVLLIVAKPDQAGVALSGTEPLGLVILSDIFPSSESKPGDNSSDRGGGEVRIGYLIAKSAWGKGYASEAVGGVVERCRSLAGIGWIAGGVAADNPASARVLERNGFAAAKGSGECKNVTERIYSLKL